MNKNLYLNINNAIAFFMPRDKAGNYRHLSNKGQAEFVVFVKIRILKSNASRLPKSRIFVQKQYTVPSELKSSADDSSISSNLIKIPPKSVPRPDPSARAQCTYC